jgi:hypothetical protein
MDLRLKFPLITLVLLLTSARLYGQADTLKPVKHYFELSFGQSLLFISKGQSAALHNKSAVVVPTNSVLFFAEFRPERKTKIPVFFNLPTESKQFLVNGQLISEKADPSFGTGLQFRVFRLKVDSRSLLDFDFGPLLTCIIGGKNDVSFAPILASRIRVKRGENFVMYIGTSYTVGLDVFGLFYGTGTVF